MNQLAVRHHALIMANYGTTNAREIATMLASE
jgi:hypothetical protein